MGKRATREIGQGDEPGAPSGWARALKGLGLLGLGAGAVVGAFKASVWPGVLVIRQVFDRDTAEVKRMLDRHWPEGITAIHDVPYRPANLGDPDATLDVFYPTRQTRDGERLPTMIWTHGGAWLSGDKTDATPYYQSIAAEGFTVVAPNYSLSPRSRYPKPLHQLLDALTFVQQEEQAERFHIDPERIVLAGDSAGAQLTSQIALLATTPGYATSLNVLSPLRAEQIAGLVLYCGIYDLESFAKGADEASEWLIRWGLGTTLRAYFGTRTPHRQTLRQMSAPVHATPAFPPVFISGGNGDPLTDLQSRPFADHLQSLGVEAETLFFPPDHEPALGHEYQYRLDLPAAQEAFERMVGFAKRRV
jgi:acetyl esterase